MTHDQNHPEHAQENGQPTNIAALLRAAADGELTDCQCEELEAYMARCPDTKSCAESQIAFEKAMRNCCGRAMSKPCCPDALRAKVAAMAAGSSDGSAVDTSVHANAPDDNEYAQRLAESNEHTRSRSFWSRAPLMSAAAALLVLAAGTLIWQSASFTTQNAPMSLNIQQASYFNRVSNFVVREHNRCCDDKVAQKKLIKNDINEAAAYFSQAFDNQLVVPDMLKAHGQIEFFGGGDCSVPSTPRSGHLRFDAIAPDGQRISLSLFVSPDPGLLPMQEGMTYPLDAEACQDAGARLFAWTSNGIQYLLVSEADENMCATVRNIMNAPTSIGSI